MAKKQLFIIETQDDVVLNSGHVYKGLTRYGVKEVKETSKELIIRECTEEEVKKILGGENHADS